MTRFALTLIALAPLTLGATACGKGKDGGGSSATKGTGMAIDAAAVNSLVPEPLKAKLVFEKQDIVLERGKDKTTYTLAYPKGWTQRSKMFGNLEAPSEAGVGFMTKLSVGSNCDGECKPKEWEKVADKVNFAPLAQGKVLKDVKGKGTRLMIAQPTGEGPSTTSVVYAWWTDGASSYHTCEATLDSDIKDAAPAFEKACQAITIVGDD